MAEAIVGVLIRNLGEALLSEAAACGGSLLCKEASSLNGLFGEIRRATGWLEIMMAYLQDSEKFRDTNKITNAFIKKIRGLAFRIEDVVDEFKYRLEDEKHGGFAAKMKKRMQHVRVWHRLALELRAINAELEDTAKQRNLFTMPEVERYSGGSDHGIGPINHTLCFCKEEDLVGVKDNAEKLKGWLLSDLEQKNIKIITVWGMGGVGKTTLVDHVYKIVKEDFDAAAWVTVSKSYHIEELLKKIARGLGISGDVSNMETVRLAEVFCNHLNGKRYILVLDNVWETALWLKIMDFFPSHSISRVILTSRKQEIASLATTDCIIELQQLEDSHSWQLFCNIAFRNNDDKKCPSELQKLALNFLEKCEGLPLAIACIGRLLSCKRPTYSAWENVYQELELQSKKRMIPGVDSILIVSLEDLPYELKNCLFQCAIFPEDYEMKRKPLVKHWITAGFIKGNENNTLEEVAEGYLNELVNRSLLQVVEKKVFGRLKCCRMHDVIRNFVLDEAEKECFGKVYEGSGTFSIDDTRRLTIQNANIAPLRRSKATHLRSIYAYTRSIDIDMLRPILTSSNLLTTLDLQGIRIKMLPIEVFSLFNLRFLGLRDTGIEILPEAVGRLQKLEVLDALGTSLLYLPRDIGKLKNLMFLSACRVLIKGTFTCGGIKVPKGIRNLTGLHALQDVKASSETLYDIAFLTELRQFKVSDVMSEHSTSLCTAIMNLSHLVSLSITTSNESELLPLEALHLPQTLYKLELVGRLETKQMPQILLSWTHLNNLAQLIIRFSKLDDDFFSSLMVLPDLCFLTVEKAYNGKTLYFHAPSFPKLRELNILGASQLEQVIIDEGGLKNLVKLTFSDCPKLKCLPDGIEYLTALEKLYLKNTAEELIEQLRQEREAKEFSEELMKISHIKKVVVELTKKNLWERIR